MTTRINWFGTDEEAVAQKGESFSTTFADDYNPTTKNVEYFNIEGQTGGQRFLDANGVGDKYTIQGTGDVYRVYDEAFTKIGTTTLPDSYGNVVMFNNMLYTIAGSTLYRIDPTNGTTTVVTALFVPQNSKTLFVLGNKMYAARDVRVSFANSSTGTLTMREIYEVNATDGTTPATPMNWSITTTGQTGSSIVPLGLSDNMTTGIFPIRDGDFFIVFGGTVSVGSRRTSAIVRLTLNDSQTGFSTIRTHFDGSLSEYPFTVGGVLYGTDPRNNRVRFRGYDNTDSRLLTTSLGAAIGTKMVNYASPFLGLNGQDLYRVNFPSHDGIGPGLLTLVPSLTETRTVQLVAGFDEGIQSVGNVFEATSNIPTFRIGTTQYTFSPPLISGNTVTWGSPTIPDSQMGQFSLDTFRVRFTDAAGSHTDIINPDLTGQLFVPTRDVTPPELTAGYTWNPRTRQMIWGVGGERDLTFSAATFSVGGTAITLPTPVITSDTDGSLIVYTFNIPATTNGVITFSITAEDSDGKSSTITQTATDPLTIVAPPVPVFFTPLQLNSTNDIGGFADFRSSTRWSPFGLTATTIPASDNTGSGADAQLIRGGSTIERLFPLRIGSFIVGGFRNHEGNDWIRMNFTGNPADVGDYDVRLTNMSNNETYTIPNARIIDGPTTDPVRGTAPVTQEAHYGDTIWVREQMNLSGTELAIIERMFEGSVTVRAEFV